MGERGKKAPDLRGLSPAGDTVLSRTVRTLGVQSSSSFQGVGGCGGVGLGTIMSGFLGKIIIILSVLQIAHASWWYLGIAGSYQSITEELREGAPTDWCSNLMFLAPRQRELCRLEDKLIGVISEGASMGIEECQNQFKNRRWNCSTYNDTNVFGKIISLQSRETAFIYAISSAGIMYSVTRACSKGALDHCGCDSKVRRQDTQGEWTWGGCSDNIRYSAKFAKDFVDSSEARYMPTGLMNMWNNGAGRKTLKDHMELVCKCHGVSGSCSLKICWRRLRPFSTVGGTLKKHFDGASMVKLDRKRNRLKRVTKYQKRPTKRDLVYLSNSPDFCDVNPDTGSLGTRGRRCNKTSYGLDGCELMCCGRGFYTLIKEERDECDCRFHWCCRVECRKCTRFIEQHFCN